MSNSKKEFPKLMQTAGKITILTALTGVMVFVVAFLFDAGSSQISRAMATSTASTTLTVLNTPPAFVLNTYELVDSSTTTPTNSGTAIQWRAIASDSNGAPYFLLVCKTNATPTANAGTGIGTVPPTCAGGATNSWAVSAGVASGVAVTISSTTVEAHPEQNVWYSWVCDDDAVNPRCNNTSVQGPTSTTAYTSPFYVNHRPVFTTAYNNGPKNPSQTVSFNSTSSDPDSNGGDDSIYLVVCQNNGGINATTRTCTSGGDIASTTGSVTDDVTASYLLASILRDDTYPAYSYLVDQHAHTATANPRSNDFVVNNVAPTLLSGDISLNGGNNITLTVPGNETTGYTLDFTARDANSCKTSLNGSEITGYRVALHRSSIATSTCTGLSGSYNPNNCYASGVPGAVWNLSCTASTTSCTGPTDDTQIYNCTFPLWFVADPTDSGAIVSPYAADTWVASVMATDDDGSNSSMVSGSSPVELISFTALDLLSATIPYGALEPGNNTGTLNATTSIRSYGNTGLDEILTGESMCGTFSLLTECRASATSTVPEDQQKFGTTSLSYGSGQAQTLSSTTLKELEINLAKNTATSTFATKLTYWGIAVPGTITLAGTYQGINSFIAKTSEALEW